MIGVCFPTFITFGLIVSEKDHHAQVASALHIAKTKVLSVFIPFPFTIPPTSYVYQTPISAFYLLQGYSFSHLFSFFLTPLLLVTCDA